MVKQVPGFLLRHTVTVEAYLGPSSRGDVYASAAVVRCLWDDATQQVTTAGGEQITSTSSYITRPAHKPPLNSRVTLPDGRATKVIKVGRVDGEGLPVPSNTQVFLQ